MTAANTRRVAWRRSGPVEVDEICTLTVRPSGISMVGTILGADDALPVRVDYSVVTDAAGFTTEAQVRDLRGFEQRSTTLTRCVSGSWSVDGVHLPALDGCTDVDLGCSPSTNALPIRRLGLRPSQSATVDVAWLRFPELAVARAVQTYTRLDQSTYRYSSGAFEASLTVDGDGLVVAYDAWRRTATVAAPREGE
jgi:uncharacterized protein